MNRRQKTHIDYMMLRASKKKPFYFFTLGHSTENLHFYKNLFIVCNTYKSKYLKKKLY